MNFAGPICNGITCAPLLVILLANVLIPIVIGAAITWALAGWFLRRINSKRQTPFSLRKTRVLRIGSLGVVASIALFTWWFPNSSILTGIIFNQAKQEVLELSIYQPESILPNSVAITLKKYGFRDDAYYMAKSSFLFKNEEVIIKEEKSDNPLFSKNLSEYEKDDRYDCFDVSATARYCKAKFNQIYHADIGEKRLIITTDLRDKAQIGIFIDSLKPRKISTINNLSITERSY